jgi:hypothetical protein
MSAEPIRDRLLTTLQERLAHPELQLTDMLAPGLLTLGCRSGMLGWSWWSCRAC